MLMVSLSAYFIEKGEFEGALKPPDSSGEYSKPFSISENVFAYA